MAAWARKSRPAWQRYRVCVGHGLLLALVTLNTACTNFDGTKLEQVKAAGKLVVLTRNSPTTFYEGPDGPTSIEYDMAKAFADHLDVELEMRVPDHFSDILPLITDGKADMAAAGITVTEKRAHQVWFAPPYQQIRQQVVYRDGTDPPRRIKDLIGRQLEVSAGTSYVERLQQLKIRYPKLQWSEATDQDTEELLEQVWDGQLELTIADSNIVALNRRYYPELRVGFNIQKPEKLPWWRWSSASFRGARGGEWLPAASELPVDLGENSVYSSSYRRPNVNLNIR